MAKFLVNANESTTWKAKVFVWKSIEHLHKAGKMEGCLAYCYTYSDKKAVKNKKNIFAEMHFALGNSLTAPIVAHECFHCTISYLMLSRIRLMDDSQAEELGAVTLEYLTSSILTTLQHLKLKVSPI